VNIQMSLYSIDFYRQYDERMDYPSGYRPQGYLFVATAEKHMNYLRANYERQVAMGLKTVRLVSMSEIVEMVPQMRADDILGGTFCSTDGFVDPYSVMSGYTLRAVDRGVRLLRNTEVTGILRDAQGIAGVRTADGEIASRVVVNAAGAWAAAIARMAGVDLPVEPLRRMLVPTEPFSELSQRLPMVIDMSTGFHFRPEGLGILMAWNDPEETPGFKTSFDHAFVEKILTRAVDRVPCLENVEVNPKRAWAGLYEMTPDHHPVLGQAPDVPGFFLANGFSGHGVMHSPATGRILADLILHGKTDLVDAGVLSLDRYRTGNLIEETAVL